MANEATLMIETELPIPFTCADGTGIEKGAVLKMTDPMTVAIADGDGDVAGGIAAEEKIANDGKTKIAVYRRGIFKVLGEGAITVGDAVITGATTGSANAVMTAGVNAENILGTALETSADAETLLIELKPFGINLA